ncbi:MAG: hypothetical protein NUV51_04290 [Sulfuricaulis sp.]|nr:hypothetical protein [Sulfuricaulis sp.]
MRKKSYLVGQVIGAASGIGACGSWLVAMWFPSSDLTLSGASFAVAFMMALLAIGAVIASIRGHSSVLMVLFFASLFPVGIFLLTVPHWLQWIGVLNLGYLMAALLIWPNRRSSVTHDSPDI